MNDMIRLAAETTDRRGLVLILTPDRARRSKTDLIASLALRGPLFIVSGDEWLPAYVLPRILRARTTEVRAIASRLYSVRASTCYRLFDSLASIPSRGEPILVMGLLHTFYDTDILLRTRLLRLRECCRELKRLAFYRPVLAMIQEMEGEDYDKFIPALLPIADQTLRLAPESASTHQPALF